MFLKKYNQLSIDSQQVQAAANVLDVTEFRLFELAYRDWFGTLGQEGELEKLYMLYWFTGLAPSWVRHYSRQVMSLSSQIGHEARSGTALPLRSTFHTITLGCLAMSLLLLLTVV